MPSAWGTLPKAPTATIGVEFATRWGNSVDTLQDTCFIFQKRVPQGAWRRSWANWTNSAWILHDWNCFVRTWKNIRKRYQYKISLKQRQKGMQFADASCWHAARHYSSGCWRDCKGEICRYSCFQNRKKPELHAIWLEAQIWDTAGQERYRAITSRRAQFICLKSVTTCELQQSRNPRKFQVLKFLVSWWAY